MPVHTSEKVASFSLSSQPALTHWLMRQPFRDLIQNITGRALAFGTVLFSWTVYNRIERGWPGKDDSIKCNDRWYIGSDEQIIRYSRQVNQAIKDPVFQPGQALHTPYRITGTEVFALYKFYWRLSLKPKQTTFKCWICACSAFMFNLISFFMDSVESFAIASWYNCSCTRRSIFIFFISSDRIGYIKSMIQN